MDKGERIVRKSLVSMALGVFALVILAGPAMADRRWCAVDPIVELNGNVVQILVAVPTGLEGAVTGPIDVAINTPTGVSQELIFTDSGFNGYGETVTFGALNTVVSADGSFETQIHVSLPIDTSLLSDLTATSIPMLVTINDGDETFVVEGESDGMDLTITVGEP
jgi:hypothetical protein